MSAYQTNTHEHNGHTIKIAWHHDPDCEPPWEHEDGHGPVSGWERRDKRPGERILCTDRDASRFYDVSEAIKIARRDGWGLGPKEAAELAQKLGRTPSRKEITAEAVERDFQYLQRWCNDEWHWCGYVVTIDGTEYHESLWGIDSESWEYFEQEALEQAQAWLDHEAEQSQDAACRDIQTV